MVASRADATRDKPKPKARAAKTAKARAAATGTVVRKKKKLHLRTRELVRFRCQNLELDLMNLRQEISTLERTRQLLYARTLNRADDFGGSLFKTIQQFYKLLRGGFQGLVWLHGTREAPLDFNQFIRVAFAEALAIGPDGAPTEPHGRDHLVQILANMTALSGAPNVQMLDVQIHRSSDNRTASVEVQTVCTSPLSVNMLEHKYAHVRRYPELRQKLVGRVIAAYGVARYVFDLRTGRIVHANIHADHAGAILQVVDTQDEYEFLVGGHHNESRFAELVDDCTDSAASPSSHGSSPPSVASSPISVSSSSAASEKVNHHVEPRTTSATMSLSFVLSTDESENE